MKRTIRFSILLFFALALGVGAVEFIVEDFEALGNLKIGGQNYGPESKVEIVSSPVKEGSCAAKVTYIFAPPEGETMSYVELFINKKLSANYGTIKLWVYGNENENPLFLRVIDNTNETFQYKFGNMSPGWHEYEVDLKTPWGHWGGNNDGRLDGPLVLQSLIVDQPPLVSGEVYFDQFVQIAEGGMLKGTIIDLNDEPVEGVRVYLEEDPKMAALTDGNGAYSFLCPAGTYTLVVEKSGYESEQFQVIVNGGQTTFQNCTLMWGRDPGVYSDKAQGSENGLKLLQGGGEQWNGEIVEIGGRKAVRTNSSSKIYYLVYDIDNSYLFDGSNEVCIFVEYFDQGTGEIGLQYHSQTSGYTLGGTITRTATNTWKTARFNLLDARFAGGTSGGDFWLGTWVPDYGMQPDAFIGKVTVMKAGRVLKLEANPKVFSPAKGAVVEVSYSLSAPATVSAWVEDSLGNRVASLAEGQEESVRGTVSWAGRTDDGELVPDGVYSIKLGPVGLAWGEKTVLMTTVEVDNSSPHAPEIVEPTSKITVNESRLLLTGRASAGAKVNVYLGDVLVGESQADSRGMVSFLLEALLEGKNFVTLREVNLAGNESEPSAPLEVNYDPQAIIGQLTASPQEFNLQTGTEVRFFLSSQQEVKLVLMDGRGNLLSELLPLAPRVGEILYGWDGKVGGSTLVDGTYYLEVRGIVTAKCKVIVDTTPPPMPLLLLPGEQVSEGMVRFLWEGDSSASQYRLSLWQEGAEAQRQVFVVNQTSWQLKQSLRQGLWLWQVEAIDAAGNSASSKVGSFTFNNMLPTTLEIINLQVGPNPFAPDGNGRYEKLQVGYTLTQPATVSIKIYNLAGKEVYERSPLPQATGDHLFSWDGRDRQGRLVARGAYLLVITASNQDRKAPSRARNLIGVLY